MDICSHDIIQMSSSMLRRMADELGVRRWSAIPDAQLLAYAFDGKPVGIIDHVSLCAMFPARADDDTDLTAGAPIECPWVVVTERPPDSGFRLFRSFGLDQAILTYWYAGET